jgi:hypothetical protein
VPSTVVTETTEQAVVKPYLKAMMHVEKSSKFCEIRKQFKQASSVSNHVKLPPPWSCETPPSFNQIIQTMSDLPSQRTGDGK